MRLMAFNTTLPPFRGPTDGGTAGLLSELKMAMDRGFDCAAAFFFSRSDLDEMPPWLPKMVAKYTSLGPEHG